jgi:signal transduction histidine kinase
MKEKAMSKNLHLACALLALACTAPVHAQSADDATALVKKAKAHLKKNGPEKACKDFADPDAGFQKGELYIVLQDVREAGTLKILCHAKNPRLNGKDLTEMKDANGKQFNKEVISLVKDKGQGWVDYRWVNPVSGHIEDKRSYLESLDGLVVVAGIYKK